MQAREYLYIKYTDNSFRGSDQLIDGKSEKQGPELNKTICADIKFIEENEVDDILYQPLFIYIPNHFPAIGCVGDPLNIWNGLLRREFPKPYYDDLRHWVNWYDDVIVGRPRSFFHRAVLRCINSRNTNNPIELNQKIVDYLGQAPKIAHDDVMYRVSQIENSLEEMRLDQSIGIGHNSIIFEAVDRIEKSIEDIKKTNPIHDDREYVDRALKNLWKAMSAITGWIGKKLDHFVTVSLTAAAVRLGLGEQVAKLIESLEAYLRSKGML